MIPNVRGMALALAAVVGVLIAGCGESAPSKAAATAYANAVNLRASDVRGMTVFAAGSPAAVGPYPDDCATQVRHSDEVVALNSPRFTTRPSASVRSDRVPSLPVEGLHSIVFVMREPALASRNVAAARSAHARSCVERVRMHETSQRFFGRERYKSQIKVALLPFPLPGIAGYGLRVSGTLAAAFLHQKTRPPFYEDMFGFAIGPAEIVMPGEAAGRPIPPATERRLLSLLYSRATAHKL